MYPRGTVPPQDKPADPEFRRHYDATETRRVTSTAPPDPEPLAPKRVRSPCRTTHVGFPGAHSHSSSRVSLSLCMQSLTTKPTASQQLGNSPSKANSSASVKRTLSSAPATRNRKNSGSSVQAATKSASSLPGTSRGRAPSWSVSTSDLRQQQLLELDKIRLLFAQSNLSFSERAFERGLLVPEDRPALTCVQNLPLPGSTLLPNPMADVRLKKRVTKKKKPKKGAVKTTKTAKTSGKEGNKTSRSSPRGKRLRA